MIKHIIWNRRYIALYIITYFTLCVTEKHPLLPKAIKRCAICLKQMLRYR